MGKTGEFVGNFLLAFVITGVLMNAAASGKLGPQLQTGARYVQRGFDGNA